MFCYRVATSTSKRNKKVSDQFIVEVMVVDYKRAYLGDVIVRDMNCKFPINISYQQAWWGKNLSSYC